MKRLFALLLLAACDPTNPLQQPGDPKTEPGQTVLPLETGMLAGRDGGLPPPLDETNSVADAAPPPPEPFEPNEALPVDRLDSATLTGASLVATWQWRNAVAPAAQATDAVKAAARAARARWTIRVAAAGRMRVEIDTRAQPVPAGTAFLARADRYGTLVLWPGQTKYRVLVPGALRNVLGEHRADVSPTARGAIEAHGSGERLGLPTRRVVVSSTLGKADFELAAIEEAGLGGPLVCRMLLEIIGVDPGTEPCSEGEVPLRAELAWSTGGGVLFEVEDVDRASELTAAELATPPPRVPFVSDGLPGALRAVFFEEEALGAFRTGGAAPAERATAENRSDRLLFLLVDGVPVATVPPWQKVQVRGLKSGRYSIQWRSFLGDIESNGSEIDLPSALVYGSESTGQPDAG
jgi:hypothetical protein